MLIVQNYQCRRFNESYCICVLYWWCVCVCIERDCEAAYTNTMTYTCVSNDIIVQTQLNTLFTFYNSIYTNMLCACVDYIIVKSKTRCINVKKCILKITLHQFVVSRFLSATRYTFKCDYFIIVIFMTSSVFENPTHFSPLCCCGHIFNTCLGSLAIIELYFKL